MAQSHDSPIKTYCAEGAIDVHLRVKYAASGNVELAGAADKDIGVSNRRVFEQGDDLPVHLRTAQGTVCMTADGAIAKGAEVFAGAAGKVSAAGTVSLGTSEQASTADGDYIEVLRG